MNALNSWIDAEAAAQAARDLVTPERNLSGDFATLLDGDSCTPPVNAEDFSIAEMLEYKGEARPEEISRVRSTLARIREKAEISGLLRAVDEPAKLPAGFLPPLFPAQESRQPAKPKVEDAPPLPRRAVSFFVPPLGPLATRIRAFADWLKRQIEADQFFILDAQGCPVTDAPKDPEVAASALILAEASRRAARHLSQPNEGALHMDLPAGKRLCVIYTETTYGGFCLAIVSENPPSPASTDRLRRALKRTVETEGGSGGPQTIS